MDVGNKVSNAALYTDFNELARLRADASKHTENSGADKTTAKVAGQIEALFFQMVLKSMREANSIGDSSESDQTRFYQDMFDKQITQELAQNGNGNGSGLAAIIEHQISGGVTNKTPLTASQTDTNESIELIRKQIQQSVSNFSDVKVTDQ